MVSLILMAACFPSTHVWRFLLTSQNFLRVCWLYYFTWFDTTCTCIWYVRMMAEVKGSSSVGLLVYLIFSSYTESYIFAEVIFFSHSQGLFCQFDPHCTHSSCRHRSILISNQFVDQSIFTEKTWFPNAAEIEKNCGRKWSKRKAWRVLSRRMPDFRALASMYKKPGRLQGSACLALMCMCFRPLRLVSM